MTTQEQFPTPYDAYQEGFIDRDPSARELMQLIAASRPLLERAVQPQGLIHASMCLEMLQYTPHAEAADAMTTEARRWLGREAEDGPAEQATMAGVVYAFMPKYHARFVERRATTVDDEVDLWRSLLDPNILVLDRSDQDRSDYEKQITIHSLAARTNIIHNYVTFQTWPTLTRQRADAAVSSRDFAVPDAPTFYVHQSERNPEQPAKRQLLLQPLSRPRSPQEFVKSLLREAQLVRYEAGDHLNGNQAHELHLLRERHSDVGELLADFLFTVDASHPE